MSITIDRRLIIKTSNVQKNLRVFLTKFIVKQI